jgi:hypothetical protein
MHDWIKIDSSSDLQRLEDHLPVEFEPGRIIKRLQKDISDAVKSILIEHYYLDKDYRSTFYNFYSKKGLTYSSDCVRLHFFDQAVEFDPHLLALHSADGRLSDHYFGFMVLRPTGIGTVGRTVLSPDVRKGADRYIITAPYKVHLLGYELTVQGFPSMDQHTDISVCGHVASWAIVRHYSQTYKMYGERLLYDITTMAEQHDPGGLSPSFGVALSQARRIFQQAKTFPAVVCRQPDTRDDVSFYRQLTAYVDSRFPLFAADHTDDHAIAIVGYDWQPPGALDIPGMRYSWDEVRSFAVVDDHHLPYLSIEKFGGEPYSIQSIDSFIVALPEKIYYPADAVERIAPAIMKIGVPLGLPEEDEAIFRYFITTSSALRRFVRNHASEYDPQLLKAIMMLPFAQFVWIAEISTRGQWAVNRVSGRAIIDATASAHDVDPFWIIHGMESALIFERRAVNATVKGMSGLGFPAAAHHGFSRMDQNLRPTRTK